MPPPTPAQEATETEPVVKVLTVEVFKLIYGSSHLIIPKEEAKEMAVLILQQVPASSVEQR